jgi:RNA polymerase sigma-70 factor (ECF subfamily)
MNEYEHYSDNELAELLSSKKSIAEKAFAVLYSRYSQRIYAYCLKVIGNKEDAGDIFQDTFMRFYNSASAKQINGNVAGYLITIARNLCLNYKRDKKPLDTFEEYRYYESESITENMEKEEMLGLVNNAINKLEDEYKEAFVLRQYHGYSYQEISDITGASTVSVKNRVWRAKEKVKKLLAPYLKEL